MLKIIFKNNRNFAESILSRLTPINPKIPKEIISKRERRASIEINDIAQSEELILSFYD